MTRNKLKEQQQQKKSCVIKRLFFSRKQITGKKITKYRFLPENKDIILPSIKKDKYNFVITKSFAVNRTVSVTDNRNCSNSRFRRRKENLSWKIDCNCSLWNKKDRYYFLSLFFTTSFPLNCERRIVCLR